MNDIKDDLNITRKRLFYNSWHRGCKETDLLLGKFAEKHLNSFNYEELMLYQEFLNQADSDIFNWMTRKSPLPQSLTNKVTNKIMNFSFNEDIFNKKL